MTRSEISPEMAAFARHEHDRLERERGSHVSARCKDTTCNYALISSQFKVTVAAMAAAASGHLFCWKCGSPLHCEAELRFPDKVVPHG